MNNSTERYPHFLVRGLYVLLNPRISAIVLSLVVLLLCGVAKGQEVTLDYCLRCVDSTYPLGRQLSTLEEMSKKASSITRSAYYPRVALEARASYQNDVPRVELELPEELTAYDIEIDIPEPAKDQYQVYAELYQLIFDGFAVRNARKESEAQFRLKQLRVQEQLEAVHRAVEGAYFGVLLLDKQLALHAVYKEELARHASRVKSLVANGVADALDEHRVALAQLAHSQRGVELRSLRGKTVDALSRLVGVDLRDTGYIFLWPTEGQGSNLEVSAPDTLVNGALGVVRAQEELSYLQERALRDTYWPVLGLFGRAGYGRPGFNMMSKDFAPYWIVGLSLRWDFGAMYTVGSERQLKRMERDLYALQSEALTVDLQREYEEYGARVRAMEQVVREDSLMVEHLQKMRDLMQLRVDEGTATVQDLLDVLSELQRVEVSKTLHDLSRLQALFAMRRLRGEGQGV